VEGQRPNRSGTGRENHGTSGATPSGSLMAGPGAITATVLLGGQAGGHPDRLARLIAVIVAVVGVGALVFFFAASRIGRILGVTANVVLLRSDDGSRRTED
jgi:small neutral amino acid transporter SnatA (MarC family)